MSLLNISLAIVASLLWIGPVVWYFWDEITHYWVRRHDKWFRQD